MKHLYLLLASFSVLSISNIYAQQSAAFQSSYEEVRSELVNWDPVRGAWLADNLPAVAMQEPVKHRTFPENFTPYQVMS